MNALKRLASEWDEFWFQEDREVSLAAFQTVFTFGLLVIYFFRFLDYSLLFGANGILPFQILMDALPTENRGILPLQYLAENETLGWSLHLLFLGCLLAQVFGFQKRWFHILTFLLHVTFLKRNPFAVYGTDMVATFWFLYLCFVQTPVRFRFQFLKKSRTSSAVSSVFNSVGLRLIQLQLCIIYAYSGLEKARGATWWNGDAIWFALGNSQVASFDFGFLVHTQWLIALMTFSTIVWEVYFPFAIWIPRIRNYMLILGVLFHIGIGVMMNLYDFSFVMLSVYILFLDEDTLTRALRRLRVL